MPEVIAGQAPPAPNAAPPQTPAPSPNAAPPAPPPAPSKPADNMKDAYSQLDRMAQAPEDIAPNNEPDGGDQPTTPDAPDTKPDEGTPTPTTDKPDTQNKQPVKAAELRTAYEQSKKTIATLEAKVKELETNKPDWDKHPEKVKLSSQLEALQKKFAEVDEELRFAKYEHHPEYKTNFEKPFFDAYAAAVNKVTHLNITDPATGEMRQANKADFDQIMRVQDDDVAADKAAELFGNKASIVLWHREKTLELQAKATTALEDFRKNGAEREKQRTEQMTNARKAIADTYHAEVKAAVEKYPQWFKAPEGNAEAADIIEKGVHLADVAFGKVDVDPDTGQPVKRSPAEMAKLNAAIRNKAGHFDYVIYQLNEERKLRKAAEKKLAQYQKSEPGGGDGGNRVKRPPMSTWAGVDEALAKLAR